MTLRLDPRTTALIGAGLVLAAAAALDRLSPPPRAETRRGSEQAFAQGLEAREIEGGVLARRWAGARLVLRFVNLEAGPLEVELQVRSQRHPVVVTHAGAVLATLAPGTGAARLALAGFRGGELDLELAAETFVARGGRHLGFLFERAVVRPAPSRWPPLSLVLTVLAPFAAALLAARLLGLSPLQGLFLAAAALVALSALLLPYGLVRSPYSRELAAWLTLGLPGLALVARKCLAGPPEGSPLGEALAAARGGFLALTTAFLVQGILPAHPCLVASDAVFHAHNLQAVSWGDFQLTSLTPHDPPFRFPYGVSFYFLQVPLLHAGADLTTLVRFFASLSACAAAAALYLWLRPQGIARAAAAVVLLQLLPVTFDLWSAGNYSNVFAQSATMLFLAWWGGRAPGGALAGGLLLVAAATAHFGAFLFLVPLGLWLAWDARRRADSTRATALGLGGLLSAGYYAQFVPLVWSQVPRLFAESRPGGPGVIAGLGAQAVQAVQEWGLPIVLLAAFGLASRKRGPAGAGPREMGGLALAGLPFLLAAALSPLEVRYLYAVAPAVALLATEGLLQAVAAGARAGWRRGLAAAALLGQGVLFLGATGRALFDRYRDLTPFP